MGDIVRVLSQLAGIGALLLIITAGYNLYNALRARKQSRSAIFNAERQSAGDRAIRATLTSMFFFGGALLLFGLALLGENVPQAPPLQEPTPTGPRRAPTAAATPAVTAPLGQPTPATTAETPPPTPTAPSTEPTPTPGQPRKTAVVSGAGENLLKLRRDPATTADIIAQYPDGTSLEVLDEQQTNQGIVWQKVRDAQGNVGWVANQYLVYNP